MKHQAIALSLPAVVYDDSHGGSGRQCGQNQIHMLDTRRNFADAQEFIQ